MTDYALSFVQDDGKYITLNCTFNVGKSEYEVVGMIGEDIVFNGVTYIVITIDGVRELTYNCKLLVIDKRIYNETHHDFSDIFNLNYGS